MTERAGLMKKLHRRRCLELSMIAAVLTLAVGAPAGAYAAGDESARGSTPGGAVVANPGGSTQPVVPATTSPASTELAPQDAGTGASSGGAAPIQRGSSVGSGGVPEKVESTSEGSSDTPDSSGHYEPESSSGYYEPEPSTSPSVEEPASTASAGSETHSAAPTPPAAGADKANDVAVGAATPLSSSKSAQNDGIKYTPSVAALFTDSGDQAASGSYVLPLLVMLALGLVILGFTGVRLWRRRKRQRLEAVWRQQDAAWEAAIRRVELVGDSTNDRLPVAH
jgi:hypothetical protein